MSELPSERQLEQQTRLIMAAAHAAGYDRPTLERMLLRKKQITREVCAVMARSTHCTVEAGRLIPHSTQAAELAKMIEPYNRVPPGQRRSLAAYYYARLAAGEWPLLFRTPGASKR
jgi:hypothetical protein